MVQEGEGRGTGLGWICCKCYLYYVAGPATMVVDSVSSAIEQTPSAETLATGTAET